MRNKELRDLIDEEARAAEAAATDVDDGAPLPRHVKVSRPNRTRSKVLQVRLAPEEFEAIERIAQRRDLPASTVAREHLLKLINADAPGVTPSLSSILAQVEQAAEGLRSIALPEPLTTTGRETPPR